MDVKKKIARIGFVNIEITGIKKRKEDCQWKDQELEEKTSRLYTPGLDNTRLFMSLTAGAGT